MTRWEASGRTIVAVDDPVPRVMGIVNATPDSFSDGGHFAEPGAAVEQARRLIEAGADLLDVGGESSRPGSDPVPLVVEVGRVLPVVEALASGPGVPISVDTTKAEVARLAIAAGAAIVNDITAMADDPEMPRLVAETGAGVVLMHMVGEVYEFLARRVEWAGTFGIPPERIALDPGIGFGKTMAHNLEILRNLRRFATLGCTLLVGTSRKQFLGTITGRAVTERATASAVSSLSACIAGARVVRVHDVAATVDAIRVWGAVRGWGGSP
jgi:dihydropteroate synthase